MDFRGVIKPTFKIWVCDNCKYQYNSRKPKGKYKIYKTPYCYIIKCLTCGKKYKAKIILLGGKTNE